MIAAVVVRERNDARFFKYLGLISLMKGAAALLAALTAVLMLWLAVSPVPLEGSWRIGPGRYTTPFGNLVFSFGFVFVWAAVAVGVVVGLWMAVHRSRSWVAGLWFAAFAALIGVILAITVARMSPALVVLTLLAAVGLYGAAAVAGLLYGRSLEGIRVAVLALLILVSVGVAGAAWQAWTWWECALTLVAIGAFSGLGALDAERVVSRFDGKMDDEELRSVALLGAVEFFAGLAAVYAWMSKAQQDGCA